MRQKLIASGAALFLAGLAAVGVFASQDAVNFQDEGIEPTATLTEEATATATDDATVEPTATATEEPTAEPTEEPTSEPTSGPTEEPTAEPTAEATPTPGEGGPRDIKGIPDHNTSHECTIVKTTPSGTQVRVPCNAVEKTHGHGHGTEGGDEDTTEDGPLQ